MAAGAALSLGSSGLAVVPGVGLMAVGVDQVVTGVYNISTGSRGQLAVEFGGYSAALGLGLGESAAQTVGQWTPAALSLSFMGANKFLSRLGGGRGVVGSNLEDIMASIPDSPRTLDQALIDKLVREGKVQFYKRGDKLPRDFPPGYEG